jgi:hypothetical protein
VDSTRRCEMHEQPATFIKRVIDAGQRFEPGVRVDFFPAEHDPRESVLEPAALGSYEVVDYARVEANARAWLEIRLRRLAHWAPASSRYQ